MSSTEKPLPGQKLADVIERILRVDHAGEYAAVYIYQGQLDVLPNHHAYSAKIQEMNEQEKVHLAQFEELLRTYQARPSALLPLWKMLGLSLGTLTALISEKTAMACTIAVEEVIEDHYAKQISLLKAYAEKQEDPETLTYLIQKLEHFLQEEVHHKEEAKMYKGEEAPLFFLLKKCIQTGCRAAIHMAEHF